MQQLELIKEFAISAAAKVAAVVQAAWRLQ